MTVSSSDRADRGSRRARPLWWFALLAGWTWQAPLSTEASEATARGSDPPPAQEARANPTLEPRGNTSKPPTTHKLILGPSEASELAAPADPRESLRRKMRQLTAEERLARRRAAQAEGVRAAVTARELPVFDVIRYEVEGVRVLPTLTLEAVLSKHTGTNISLQEILKAATDLQEEYRHRGSAPVSVALAPKQITNGVVLLSVFEAASPQIVVGGRRYEAPVAPKTNAPPKFIVRGYEVIGDTLLSDETLNAILGPFTGTNIGVAEILQAGSELQLEYRDRGYPTVGVTIPPQQITNGTVQIRVFEGELIDISVTGNRYFSSNNVMRALPGLRTNEVLVGPAFQTELDRANANQDRQIYPELMPGPEENTSALVLKVKDRLPLHAKVEFNNQNSPGTPDLRINTSAAYNNLWQLEHSIGVQYNFSPQEYKSGDQWNFYDLPMVANYSAFYRLPLGDVEPLARTMQAAPGSFGYDEATRKFRLPTPSGRPELTFYASRATIDTGVETVFNQTINTGGTNVLIRKDVQQDLTENNNIGARLTAPMPASGNWLSALAAGLDFKTYQLASHKTNTFTTINVYVDESGQTHTNIDTVPSPVPNPSGVTIKSLEYFPLSFRYDGSVHGPSGTTSFGLGLSFNPWYSGSLSNLQSVSGSTHSSGHWVAVTPSIGHDFIFHTNWTLSVRLDGQVASEPLIANEQFGAGGVNSVRGYPEGEVFGDDGWHVSLEQKTPASVIGLVGGKFPLTVRGSVYMDYAETYLLDPQGRDARTPLWGVGAGAVVSVGTYWEGRLLFSVPMLKTPSTEAYQPRFNFALTGQF